MQMSNGCTLCRHNIKKILRKTVVGVDRPISAHLRINVENLHKKLSKFKQLKFCQKYFFFKIIFLHAHVQCDCIVKAKYQIAPAKTVVGVDRPV